MFDELLAKNRIFRKICHFFGPHLKNVENFKKFTQAYNFGIKSCLEVSTTSLNAKQRTESRLKAKNFQK